MISSASEEKYGWDRYGRARPIRSIRPVRRLRATELGRKSSSAMAALTFCRVCSLTLGSPLTTRETVFSDTPARWATSCIVDMTEL